MSFKDCNKVWEDRRERKTDSNRADGGGQGGEDKQ